MEKYEPKQEILLLTASSFAKRDLCNNDSFENPLKRQSAVEKLEEACWNGLLDEFLNSVPANRKNGDKLFLWKIRLAAAFLCVELYQAPSDLDRSTSLNPYLFLSVKTYN